MKKELTALVCAIVVCVLVLSQVTALVSPKRHSFGSDWGEFLQEPEDSVDVLFIGSSLTYCNIIPALFWQETGLTAWDLTGPELTVPGAYHYLVEALKTQHPTVVFVEISAVLYPRYTNYDKTVIGQMPWGLNRLALTLEEGKPEHLPGLLFPMYFYHSRWTELEKDDFEVYRKGYQADLSAGYTYLNQYAVISGYMERTDVGLDVQTSARNVTYLHKIAEVCREEGIIPVFYESPAASTMPSAQMDGIRQELAAIEGAVVVNFNDHRDTIGAELAYDYYDALHYNAAGAQKFTRYLSRWFLENLQAQPKPGQDTGAWQSRLDYILELLESPMNPR